LDLLVGNAQLESLVLFWWWRLIKFLYRLKAGDLDCWLLLVAAALVLVAIVALCRQLGSPTRQRRRPHADVVDWRYRGGG
jgi:hypothetical protein